MSIRELSRTAKERRSGSLGYAEAMVLIYNKRFQNGSQNALPMNNLYTHKVKAKKSETEIINEGIENPVPSAPIEQEHDATGSSQMNLEEYF